MRALQAPAAAGLSAAVLLGAAVLGCGTAQPSHQSAGTKAATAVASTSAAAVTGLSQASDRLTAIAFTSPAQGYGVFSGQGPRRCSILAGATHDGGTRF